MLRELAEQMTTHEAVEQLTGAVDRILAKGTHSEHRPGVLYKIFEEDPKEGLPRITIGRDSMTSDGQGDHLKVSFDYPHVSTIEGTALTHTDHHGVDYEWRVRGASVQEFSRDTGEELYQDPSGEIRFRAPDATHRDKQVFNNSPVRNILSNVLRIILIYYTLAKPYGAETKDASEQRVR